jgi:hypothetical protein
MCPKDLSARHAQMRIRIAQLAAQLMAEHGIRDYGLAKRKAARQLGAPDSHSLPGNDEIDAALKDYQALYLSDIQADHIAMLRQQALAVMRALARFEPTLVGGVANGSATRHADIEIEAHADSGKDFEQYLLNQGIDFKIRDRGEQAAYLLYSDPADVLIWLMPERQRLTSARQRNEPQQRLSIEQLADLLGEAADIRAAG